MSSDYQSAADPPLLRSPSSSGSRHKSSTQHRNAFGCACSNTLLLAIVAIIALSISLLVAVIVLSNKDNSNSGDSGGGNQPDQLAIEQQFRNELDGTRIGVHLYNLTFDAHIAGSPENMATAIYVRDQLRSFGLSTELQPFDVLLCYPTQTRSVEVFSSLSGPLVYTAVLKEANYTVDPSTFKPAPDTFLAYSANGRVKAEVFYANYGQHSDFEALAALGINMTGKIALMRYGNIYRGNKVSNAAQFGAIGALIYSDPKDTGFVMGTPYPNGSWGTEWSVQRGSIWNGNGGQCLLCASLSSVPMCPLLRCARAPSHCSFRSPSCALTCRPRHTRLPLRALCAQADSGASGSER